MLSGRLRGALAVTGVVGLSLAGQAGSGGTAGTRVVERGETLSAVARSLGVSVADLARVNDIANVHKVQAGRRLVVPGKEAPAGAAQMAPPLASAVVAPGQTLSALARSLGVSVADLARANNITNVHRVQAGRRLVVPTPSAPTAAPVGAAAAALPDRLRQLPDRLALVPVFDAAAREFGVPADLLKAMTWLESGWRNDRVSSTKALGIGQLMPATVEFVNGVLLKARLDPHDPHDNIRMSARFLSYLLRQNDGDVPLALASYYQGLASVRARGPLPESHRYVANVVALRQKF